MTVGGVLSDTPLTRSIHLAGDQFRKGATAPADVTIGATPTINALRFAATNELASVYASLPAEVDLSQTITLRMQWALAAGEVNNDTLDITCDYTAVVERVTASGPGKASTQRTGIVTVTTGEGLAAGDVYVMDITFLAGDATNPLANAVGLAIEIHLTNTTGVASADLIDADLIYTALL